MTCLSCGSNEIQTQNENIPLVGLPTVILVGVAVARCQNCGDYEIAIPRHSRLIEIVSLAILNKKGKLTGNEIRWLRARIGWTGVQLARHVGVSQESVSKWERGHVCQSRMADRLIRLLAARHINSELYPDQALPLVSGSERNELQLRLQFVDSDWILTGSWSEFVVADPTLPQWAACG